jgi:hypothetical protein
MVSRITAKALCPTLPSEIAGPDQISRIYVGLGHELVDLNRTVESTAMFSSSSFDNLDDLSVST